MVGCEPRPLLVLVCLKIKYSGVGTAAALPLWSSRFGCRCLAVAPHEARRIGRTWWDVERGKHLHGERQWQISLPKMQDGRIATWVLGDLAIEELLIRCAQRPSLALFLVFEVVHGLDRRVDEAEVRCSLSRYIDNCGLYAFLDCEKFGYRRLALVTEERHLCYSLGFVLFHSLEIGIAAASHLLFDRARL